MDLNRLPRMSQTPPPQSPPAPTMPYASVPLAPSGISPISAFVSLVIGLICIMLASRFFGWLFTTIGGGTYNTGATWVNEPTKAVGYFELSNYVAWTELGTALLGIALLLDAALLLTARLRVGAELLLWIATLVMACALVINLGLAIFLFTRGVMPIFSLMAVLVAGVTLFGHAELLQQLRRARRYEEG